MHPGALAELVSLSFMRGKAYDHLVVECSGIAEPRLVRRLFQDAQAALYHAYTLA
jgi:G3E family GTPase